MSGGGPRFDAVLFDAGGVLVVPDPIAIAPVCRAFGGDPRVEDVVRAHYAGMRAQDVDATAHDDWDVYKRRVLRMCGVPEERVEPALVALRRVWAPYVWRFPLAESVAALHQLRVRGVPIGVVSNASGQIEGVLAALGVCQVGPGAGVPVRVVVDSEVVGVMKPDPRIFEPALEVLGLAPGRVAYVGDSVRNDVRGAEAAGLVPLHLDPYGDHPDAGHERIASLHDLLAMV